MALGRPTRDRHELFASLREHAPLLSSPALGSLVLSRYDDVRELLDSGDFAHVTRGPGMTMLRGGFQAWHGQEHSRKMGIVARRLRTPRALRDDVSGRVETVVQRLAGTLPLGERVDLKSAFTDRVPLLVFCDLAAIDDADALGRWAAAMVARASGCSYDDLPLAGAAALRDLEPIVMPLVRERRAVPGPDLVSDLANAAYDGAHLPDAEVVLILAQLFVGTFEAERLLTSAFHHLASHPAAAEALRSQLDDDDAVASFGAEALRLFSPIQAVTRTARADAEVAGRTVAAGRTVIGLLGSANRDERRFADPERFVLDRFRHDAERQFTPSGEILPFGAGEHYCTGARVGQLMIVHAVRALLGRARVEAAGDAPFVGGLMSWAPASLPVVLRGAS